MTIENSITVSCKEAKDMIKGKSVTPEQAVEMMEKINKAEEEMLNPKNLLKIELKQ